jgi:hypothetical protein
MENLHSNDTPQARNPELGAAVVDIGSLHLHETYRSPVQVGLDGIVGDKRVTSINDAINAAGAASEKHLPAMQLDSQQVIVIPDKQSDDRQTKTPNGESESRDLQEKRFEANLSILTTAPAYIASARINSSIAEQGSSLGKEVALKGTGLALAGLSGFSLYRDYQTFSQSPSAHLRQLSAVSMAMDGAALAGSIMMTMPPLKTAGHYITGLSLGARMLHTAYYDNYGKHW